MVPRAQLADAERRATALQAEVEQLRSAQPAAQARRYDTPGEPRSIGGGTSAMIAELREANKQLNGQVEELRRAGGPALAQDVKRLRQENEQLHAQVGALQRANGSAGSAANQQLADAVSERNRLATRVDELLREMERGKAHYEAGLKRVMAANAKLLREKEGMERELRQVSQLYQETFRQLQTQGGGNPSGGDVLPRLQEDLAAAREQVKALEADNASLKSRIRKL